jgi:hypothetical protein
LHDHWADATTPPGRLMLTILGGLAEFERSLIKARTDVGIKRAREAGIRFGRPPKLTRHQQEQAVKLLDQGEPQSAVARLLNVDQSTPISRLASRVAGPRQRKVVAPAELAQLSIRSLVNDVASPRNLVQFRLHRRKAHRPASKPVDRMQCTFDAATTSRASLADASDRKAPDGPDDGRRSRSGADIRLNLRTV